MKISTAIHLLQNSLSQKDMLNQDASEGTDLNSNDIKHQ